jgi:hypothetical protein
MPMMHVYAMMQATTSLSLLLLLFLHNAANCALIHQGKQTHEADEPSQVLSLHSNTGAAQ